jgi:hypothetical protein
MTDKSAEQLIAQIRQDMHQAIKDRNRLQLDELRSLLAAISNAEAVPLDNTANTARHSGTIANASVGVGSTEAVRKQLTYDDVGAVIADEIAEIESVLEDIDPDSPYAIELHDKIRVAQKYLQ